MGPMMKLIEAIRDLDSLDDKATIYASEPWKEDSRAVVELEPELGELPAAAQELGLKYFLEVFIARDFLEGWSANLGARPSLQQRCSRLIRYARDDA
jgi:hypothetical protein